MPGIAFPGVWPNERVREQFSIEAEVVEQSIRTVTSGHLWWRRVMAYDVFRVRLNFKQLREAWQGHHHFKILNDGGVNVPNEINILQKAEDSHSTELPVGTKVKVTFGYATEKYQWYMGLKALEVMALEPA